jgi:kumamolisin
MRRRASWVGAAALLVLVVLIGAYLVPSAGAQSLRAAPPIAVAPSPATGIPPVYSDPFSARAGYANWYSAGVTGATPATGTQSVVVTFEPSSPDLFSTPAFGAAPLSMAAIAGQFGLPADRYDAFEQYFQSQGLTVVHTWPDRLSLSLEGNAAAVGRAFGTTELTGSYAGHPATYPATPPVLPASLQPYVGSVLGLSSGFDTFSLPLAASGSPIATPAQSNTPVTPGILRQWYRVSSLYNITSSPTYASHEAIAVLLWGDGYAPSDIQTFFSRFYPSGFPQPQIAAYPVDGAPSPSAAALNDPDRSAPQELTLDLEWAGSFAPGATLDAVYAPEGPAPSYSPSSADMADALHQAILLPGVTTLSMSFGTPEQGDASLMGAWSTYLAEAEHEDITLLAATGDLGGDASAGCTGGPSPDYPATDPNVIAVGGTVVTLQQNLLGGVTGIAESGWIGSGGGYSTQFPAPSWQVSLNSHRGTPDVSGSASDNFLYYAGQQQVADGTSFATPLWAGLIAEMDALHGAPFGFLTPRLYAVGENESSGKIGDGLNDVTSGGNCVANAVTGWDAATGWGSPRAVDLYEALTSSFVNLSIAVSPDAVAPAGSITISAHLANATTGDAIAGVPVVVSLVSDEDFGPCTGSFGSASPATDAAGDVNVAFTVPVCYLGSHAIASVAVISNGYYGLNSTTLPVNLLALVPSLEGITAYPGNIVGFIVIMAVASAIGGVLGMRGPSGRPEYGVPEGVSPGSEGPPPAAPDEPAPPPPSAPPESSPPPPPPAGPDVGR